MSLRGEEWKKNLLVLSSPVESLQNCVGFIKKLEQTGPAEKEEVASAPQSEQLASRAAAPGFNSLIPAPSVPSLTSTEPVELLCRASNISSTDPFGFVKQKKKTGSC